MHTPTILIADDEDGIRTMLTIFLTRLGYHIATAHDGRDAIFQATIHHPAVILMDLSMPVLTGWEATAHLKADPCLKTIPIIAMTAHGLGHYLTQALAAGIDDFLLKPLDLHVLLALIHRYVEPVNVIGRAA